MDHHVRRGASRARRASIAWLAFTLMSCGGGSSSDNSGSSPSPAPNPTPSSSPSPTPSPVASASAQQILGVQTHFSQGWPTSHLNLARQVNAGFLRDSLPWAKGEKVAGIYDFTSPEATALDAACAAGFRLSMTQVPRNPAYEDGNAVSTIQGQRAFAAYLDALIAQYGECIVAIEIGNEINGASGAGFAKGVDPTSAYISLLKAVRGKLGSGGSLPDILGGSTNMIGTGFLEDLFKAGMLPLVDGIAVHPYLRFGDGYAKEIRNLREVMRDNGGEVPIWASEFSHDIADETAAANRLVRTATLLAESGVQKMSWYALIEQPFFPNMKLFSGTKRVAQGDAFRILANDLLPYGRPKRISFSDPGIFAFRFGSNRWAVWGLPRRMRLPQGASVLDARGNLVSPSGGEVAISENPLIVIGATQLEFGPSEVLADSLLQYAEGVFSYYAERPGEALGALSYTNGQYDSFFANRYHQPLRISSYRGAPGGDGNNPSRALWRFKAPADGQIQVASCFANGQNGDGIDITIRIAGKTIAQTTVDNGQAILRAATSVEKGSNIDVLAGPHMTSGDDSFLYRIRIGSGTTALSVECP